MKTRIPPVFLYLFALVGPALSSGQAANVEKWHPTDLSFTTTTRYANPFQNVSILATFTGPGGVTLSVPGFYEGNQTWKVRFSPTVAGNWTYTTSSADAQLNGQTGAINCVANTNAALHGALKVDATHPHFFAYEDGTPSVQLGFEADWLGLMDFGDPNVTKARSLIDMYASNGFNLVFLNVYAYDTSWKPGITGAFDFGPTALYPWLGTNSAPDHAQMNPAFFDNLDRVVDHLFQRGITAHLMFKVYNKSVNWPVSGSADDNLYFSYVTARYQAYPNMIWDFSKETFHEKNNTYINNMLTVIKKADAYKRLVTVHDGTNFLRAFPNSVDFKTMQVHGNYYGTQITELNARKWPVMNAEYDYQVGNDGGFTYTQHQTQSVTLHDTLEVLMSGGAACYYYTFHAWDVARYNEVPNGLSAYKNAAAFFKGTHWNSLAPSEGLINNAGVGRHCLAIPGAEYVVYLSGTGSVTLTVGNAPSGNSMSPAWLNTVTGVRQTLPNVGNGATTFANPWTDPALLHLTISSVTSPPRTTDHSDATSLMAYISAPAKIVLNTDVIASRTLNVSWFNPATGATEVLGTNLNNTGNCTLEKRAQGGVVIVDDSRRGYALP